MKRKITKKDNIDNLFKAMSYELAGDIGAIDNEDMINNKKIINTESPGINQLESKVGIEDLKNTTNKHKNIK